MGRTPTPAEQVVLGLIAECPRHELDRIIEERGIRAWTDLAFSSVYYLLGRLERAGWIQPAPASDHRGRRRTFEITSAGRAVARDATRAALRDAPPPHPPDLVGIANLFLLDGTEALEALRRRVARLSEEYDRLGRHPRRQMPAPPYVEAIFDYGISALHAELNWARRTIAVLVGLRDGLRSGDVFVPGSRRYANPASFLLTAEAWAPQKLEFCHLVGKRAQAADDELHTALADLEAQLAKGSPGEVRLTDDGEQITPPLTAEDVPAEEDALRAELAGDAAAGADRVGAGGGRRPDRPARRRGRSSCRPSSRRRPATAAVPHRFRDGFRDSSSCGDSAAAVTVAAIWRTCDGAIRRDRTHGPTRFARPSAGWLGHTSRSRIV